MLDGFNIPVSYGRLREACQTDVDGTSIDTMEDVACQLGLQAEQNVVPPDHILRDEAHCLPAIAVTSLPNGLTHFIVVWRRWGQWVQIMDPGEGRQIQDRNTDETRSRPRVKLVKHQGRPLSQSRRTGNKLRRVEV